MKKTFIKNKKSGFTLIEIMVAMAIFMIVMLTAVGGFVVVSNSAKKAKALRVAMDNVNFAMENMSRSLRLGSNYFCANTIIAENNVGNSSLPTQDCSSGGKAIIYYPYNSNESEAFQISPSFRSNIKTVEKVTSTDTIDLTSPEVNITDLRFFVKGSDPNDEFQPSVFIIMKGEITIAGEQTDFAIQTLASQRNAE